MFEFALMSVIVTKYNYILYNRPRHSMDLSKIFSGRVIGMIVFIFVVLFIGTAFNANLEGFNLSDLTKMGGVDLGNSSAKSDTFAGTSTVKK